MAIVVMLEAITDAFLLAQSMQQMQVAFIVLHAVFAGGVEPRQLLKSKCVFAQPVVMQQTHNDLRRTQSVMGPAADPSLQPLH